MGDPQAGNLMHGVCHANPTVRNQNQASDLRFGRPDVPVSMLRLWNVGFPRTGRVPGAPKPGETDGGRWTRIEVEGLGWGCEERAVGRRCTRIHQRWILHIIRRAGLRRNTARRATIGSVSAARRAGSQEANSATSVSRAATAAKAGALASYLQANVRSSSMGVVGSRWRVPS